MVVSEAEQDWAATITTSGASHDTLLDYPFGVTRAHLRFALPGEERAGAARTRPTAAQAWP